MAQELGYVTTFWGRKRRLPEMQLNEYEFNDIVTLENVVIAIQRAEMVMRIVEEIQRQIYELGDDGRLVKMQLDELIGGLEKEEELIIKR